ncbi:MAG: PAS domain-containing protein [Acidobacteriaceae bacterium]|nr:PAS domain-containing protein [Acidobacteriaceae bacterium]
MAERTGDLAAANRSLAESEWRFRTMADSVPDLLWTTDANGVCMYTSGRFSAYTRRTADELRGWGWLDVVHPEDRPGMEAVWMESVRTAAPYEVEYRLQRFDGEYRWFVARGVPIKDDVGQVVQWFGSSTDIDELKRTEAALRRSNDELEQFAYAAAHDLQEPMRNVSNSLSMMLRRYEDRFDEDGKEWIALAVEGAQRMQTMVKDLLLYSRAVSDDRMARESDAGAAVQEALRNLNGALAETKAKVETETLPRVAINQTHLVSLFQNLIGNSLKYRLPDNPPEVRVCARPLAAEWEFVVKDNGIGFDPAYTDRIFKVFKRLHTRDQYPGNGIGLAICARIVSHYGGRIWAEGRPGKGAAFHFTVPGQK